MFRRVGKLFAGIAATCVLSGTLVANDFEEVSRHLDQGGDYYEISRTAETGRKLTDCFHELKTSVATLDLPEDQRAMFGNGFEIAEALIEYAGFKEIAATGKSSKAIGDGLFCNRAFYLLKQPARGLVWNALAAQNSPILDAIGTMPVGTMEALVVDLDFSQEAFLEQLQKLLPPRMRTKLKESGIDLKELGASLNGRWQFLLFPGNSFLCIIPDSQKKVFSFLQGLLGDECETQENGTMTREGIVVGHNDGWLIVAKNFAGFDDGFSEIKDTENFQKAAKNLASDGVAAYFNTISEEPEIVDLFGIPVNLAAMGNRPLGVVRRESNGFALQTVSDMTIPCENWMTAIHCACRILALLGEEPAASAEDIANQHDLCQKNLQTLYATLAQYRDKNDHFPTGMQADGWKALLDGEPTLTNALICPDSPRAQEDKVITPENCSYIYFGDWGKDADGNLPLVIDFPRNHANSFNVLYCDGSVATLEQENVTSVRKAASVLHTVNRYNEAHFIELMRRAALIDQLLKLE